MFFSFLENIKKYIFYFFYDEFNFYNYQNEQLFLQNSSHFNITDDEIQKEIDNCFNELENEKIKKTKLIFEYLDLQTRLDQLNIQEKIEKKNNNNNDDDNNNCLKNKNKTKLIYN
jgi:hypothetical protein